MLRFRSLASGSSGNATLLEAREGQQFTRVLVDCGLGLRQLAASLATDGLAIDDLDGVFITHEHGDHIGCAAQLVARHRVALWTSAGTAQALQLPPDAASPTLVRDGQVFAIGGIELRPFTVPHDAREPLQLRCSDGDRVLGILTDLGHVTAHALQALAGAHALLLESNHDPDMLARSRYPEFLKRRVAGAHGHLSNSQAATALAALQHARLASVTAAHLSERNNLPELARQALAGALGCAEGDILAAARDGSPWIGV